MQLIRILIDKDNTVYDLHEPWLNMYNADNPDNPLKRNMLTTWEMSYDIYKYLEHPEVYTTGGVIEGSIEVTKTWIDLGHEVAFVTTAARTIAATLGLQWLSQHFPHIPNVVVTQGHIKHWIDADFLIDDGLHNLKYFKGIPIIFDQPWNQQSDLPRARNWQEVHKIVTIGTELLSRYPHHIVQRMIEDMQTKGNI